MFLEKNSHFRSRGDISREGTESWKLRVYFERPNHFSCRDNLTQVRREMHFWHTPFNICTSAHPTPSKDLHTWPAFCCHLHGLLTIFPDSLAYGLAIPCILVFWSSSVWSGIINSLPVLAMASWAICRLLATGAALFCSCTPRQRFGQATAPPGSLATFTISRSKSILHLYSRGCTAYAKHSSFLNITLCISETT